MDERSIYARLSDAFGGIKKAAAAIGVTQTAISNWSKQGYVPAERCPKIEGMSGVRCEDLNPYVEWGVLRGKKLEMEACLNEEWWRYAC